MKPATLATWSTILTVLVLGMLVVPLGQAALTQTYGTAVKKTNATTNDPSEVFFDVALSSSTYAQLAYRDCDGSAGLTAADPWYVDMGAPGSGTVTTNDLRVTGHTDTDCGTSQTAGTRVASGDSDNQGGALVAGGALCYIDRIDNGQNDWNPTDTAYIALDGTCGTATTSAAVDDVCFSSGGTVSCTFGSRFTTAPGGDGRTFATDYPGLQFEVYDLDNSGSYTNQDGVYLDLGYTGTAGFASPGDIRLTNVMTEGPGTVVEKGDIDVVYRLTVTSSSTFTPTLHKNTDDASNLCTGSTPPRLYLSIDAASPVGAGDVRVSAVSSFQAGTVVATGDSDVGAVTVVPPTSGLDFADVSDNNNVFDAGDVSATTGQDLIYFDSNNDNEVDVNEVLISKTSSLTAGTCIASGSTILGITSDGAVTQGPGLFKYLDADNSQHYNRSATDALADLLYADMDSDSYVTVGDVRFFPSSFLSSSGQFGDVVDSDDTDVAYVLDLLAAQTTGVFCHQDTDGGSNYDSSESAYLRLSDTVACGVSVNIAPGDLRLTSFSTLGAGLLVRGGDSDSGNPMTDDSSGPAFRYFDVGQTGFQDGDFLYADMDLSGKINVGDILLTQGTHGTAGDVISSADTTALNGDLVAFAGYEVRGFDMDGDGAFATSDLVVWDDGLTLGGLFFVNAGDAFLTGTGGTTNSFTTSSGGGGGGGGGTPPPEQSNLPVASFSCSGILNRMQLTVDASGSYKPGGTISSYEWDWGDGSEATGVQRSHLYDEAGDYTIVLTIVTNANEVRSTSRVVTVPLEQENCLAVPDDDDTPPDDGGDDTPPDDGGDDTPPDDGDDGGDEPKKKSQPGLGLIGVLAALGAALVLVRRRN